MSMSSTRRSFIAASGTLFAAPYVGATLSGRGGSPLTALSESEQLGLTAAQALDAMRAGTLTAEAYTTTLLKQAALMSDLNSMISLDSAGAIEAARNVDQRRARGESLPLLAGLPIVVKDNINTRALPTTGGTPALRNVRPTANAPTLQRLLDAGAIVLGKANMHELAFGATTSNFAPFAGIAHNPYDRSRVPGGSSGGTGAAIAARIAPAGLGTDTGGSVRIPASFCGLSGLRPSVGNGGAERRYDGSGVLPISHTRDTIGPMARTMRDVALLDAVMSGTAPAERVPLAGIRLGVPVSFWAGAERQVLAVLDRAMKRLSAAGVVFVNVDTAGLDALTRLAAFPIALHEAHEDIPRYLDRTGVQGISLADISAQVASPDVKGPMSAVVGDAAAAGYQDAINKHRPAMRRLYADYFASNRLDGAIFPTVQVAAPVIDAVNGTSRIRIDGGPLVDTFPALIKNTDPGSTTGIPGITVPAGLTPGGLPVGLAIDGPIGSDVRLLGLGMAIEDVLGPLPPPKTIGTAS
ncbi:indoleacetamide hydrolase [Paracidovorax wautersii]|uniref:indoleacetamide hydrolase n=1 Tax=Paracidovorax wautersii TaxID=1177982 RepID=UPI0031D66A81